MDYQKVQELMKLIQQKALIKLKPKMIRIYPVLVIKGTKLEKEYNEGIYEPLSVVQAVEICKQLVRMFTDKKNRSNKSWTSKYR